jgi:hypothetical protein
MYFGFAFLYLLAIGFYFLAWAFSWDAVAAKRPKSGFAAFARAAAAQVKSLIAGFGL